MRYAQEKPGQKLHLVTAYADDSVANIALCGRRAATTWRLTINIPLGSACRRCTQL